MTHYVSVIFMNLTLLNINSARLAIYQACDFVADPQHFRFFQVEKRDPRDSCKSVEKKFPMCVCVCEKQ